MNKFANIFRLELLANLRSRSIALLTAVNAVWMLASPWILKSDGTAEGARQLDVRYSLGISFTFIVVSLAAAAAASIAKDRTAKRLQLTMIKPVHCFTVAFGRAVALMTIAAAEIFLAIAILLCRTDVSTKCDHVLYPEMESVREEAERMYKGYMADPETPEEIRKLDRETVLRILERKAPDHYQTVPSGSSETWDFDASRIPPKTPVAVRLRLTNAMDTREDIFGQFTFDGATDVVSNMTLSVLHIPLHERNPEATDSPKTMPLVFDNKSAGSLMLRPRQDIQLLVAADSFAWNAVRAGWELTAMASVTIAFAMFLGAGLSRSVAVFTVMAMLFASVIAPTVTADEPDELESSRADKTGVAVARFTNAMMRPFASLTPLEHLSKGECVERDEVAAAILGDMALLPILLALAAAAVMPRKQDAL